MAPLTPFLTEVLYQNMRKVSNAAEESIHHCSFPEAEGKVLVVIMVFFKKKLRNQCYLIHISSLMQHLGKKKRSLFCLV
jgi:isoleucyl-tRNA synthetase